MPNSPQKPERSPRAVLLIAHGSRRPEANADLAELAQMVRQSGRFDLVELAYLDVVEPTIPQGLAACVRQGAAEVRMMPYFLSAGSHVADDLRRYCREAQREHGEVRFQLCPPLGLHPKMIEIVLDRLGEELDGDQPRDGAP